MVSIEQVVPGLYSIRLEGVNAFLIDADELALIDTGSMNSADTVLDAVHLIGRTSSDLRHILVTHCHPDHAGSLAALQRRTGAAAHMHALDAAIARTGNVPPHLKPSPGMLDLFSRFIGFDGAVYEAAVIDHEVHDGDVLPIAGGMRAIHVPGHCAGQLAFLWNTSGGVLFAADTASNMMGLGTAWDMRTLKQASVASRSLPRSISRWPVLATARRLCERHQLRSETGFTEDNIT